MDSNQKSSIDKSELEKFDKISNEWLNPKGKFKILHDINPIRVNFVTDKIHEHFNCGDISKLTLLDVGCGGGLVSSELCKKNLNVTAIDASINNIKIAKDYAENHNLNINYLNINIEEIENKQYDIVLCLEVIEHVANIEFFVANLTKLVKKDGMLIISTINRNIKSYFLGIIMAEYILGWVPKETHNYNKFVKPSELNKLLRVNNMYIKELKGLSFNLLNQIWHLSQDIGVNYFAYIKNINN